MTTRIYDSTTQGRGVARRLHPDRADMRDVSRAFAS